MSQPPGSSPTPEEPTPGPQATPPPGAQPTPPPPPPGAQPTPPPPPASFSTPGYGAQPYAPVGPGATASPANGKASASLIVGLSTLVLSWCCGLGLLGIVAVVLGVRARAEIRASAGGQGGDGMALAGIITGAVAAVLGLLILLLIGFAFVTGAGSASEPTVTTGA